MRPQPHACLEACSWPRQPDPFHARSPLMRPRCSASPWRIAWSGQQHDDKRLGQRHVACSGPGTRGVGASGPRHAVHSPFGCRTALPCMGQTTAVTGGHCLLCSRACGMHSLWARPGWAFKHLGLACTRHGCMRVLQPGCTLPFCAGWRHLQGAGAGGQPGERQLEWAAARRAALKRQRFSALHGANYGACMQGGLLRGREPQEANGLGDEADLPSPVCSRTCDARTQPARACSHSPFAFLVRVGRHALTPM